MTRPPSAAAPDHRARPRRRGAALDRAILEATIAEIEVSGYADLSVERVAERARTGKASLYRRWPSKVELVMAAVYQVLPDPGAVSDTGNLRGDLLALLRSAADLFSGPAGTAIRGLLSDALRDPHLATRFRSYTRGRSAAIMQEIVARAGLRGELDPAAITLRQRDAGLSLLRFHLLTTASPLPDTVIVEIVDEVVLPLFRRPGGQLQGPNVHDR